MSDETRVVPDNSWAIEARDTRDALALLGYRIDSRCMPGEADPCGATFAMHAAAHFTILKAVADHQLKHLGRDLTELTAPLYWDTLEQLEGGRCQLHHPPGG